MNSRTRCLTRKLFGGERSGSFFRSLLLLALIPETLGKVLAASVPTPIAPPPPPPAPPTNQMTIAVLAFENRTGDPSLDFWHLAPEWLLAASLEAVGTIQIASEEGYALRQLHLKLGDPLEPAQARKIGELLEARRVIWGSYERQGKKWLVTAHILNVATGESLKDVDAASTDWFELRDELAMKILQQLNVVPTTTERERMRKRWTRSQESLEWICRARALREAQKPESEIEAALRRAAQIDPRCAFTHTQLAMALWYEGRLEDAEKEARLGIKWRPDWSSPHFVLGSLLTQRQKYQEAEKSLQTAEGLDPRDAMIKEQMGVLYDHEGLGPKGTQCYEQASQLAPLSPSIHARLGYSYVTGGRSADGRRELKEAERLGSGSDLNAEECLAYAYAQLREVPAALAHFQMLVEMCKKRGLNPERARQLEEYAQQLKARLTPVYVNVLRPKDFGEGEFAAFLRQKLDPADIALVTNVLECTPEMQRWAQNLAAEATNDFQKAQLLFEALAHHVSPGFGGTRTAQQVFADWNTPNASFLCAEYAAVYVALSRACGVDSCCTLVEQDCYGRTVAHECACVFLGTKALLVDPSFYWFGVPHRKFTPLNDVEATAAWLSEQRNLKQKKIACELAPNMAIVRFNHILALIEADDVQSAKREFASALKLAPDSVYEMLVRAGLALNKGDTGTCISWTRKAISLSPDSSNCYVMLGHAYTARRKFSEALEAYHSALQKANLDEVDADDVRKAIAQINEITGGNPTARKAKPKSAAGFLGRGDLYLDEEAFDKAVSDYDQAAKLNQNDAAIYGHRAYAYLQQGEMGKAIADCQAAIHLDPNDALVWSYLAHAYGQKDEASKEIAKLRKELKADPNNFGAYSRLAALQAKRPDDALKNVQEAVRAARRACELTGWQNWQYVACLAEASAEAGDYEAAAKYDEQASKIPGIEERAKLYIQQWLSNYYTWHDSLVWTNFSKTSEPAYVSPGEKTVDLLSLKRSAESGDAKAQAELAGFLNDGTHGCPTNRVEAYKWAALAASQGNKDAHYLVQELELFMKPADLVQAKASVQDFLNGQKSGAASPRSE